MVKRNPFTTANQVNNTLQGVGVSTSKSTIKRRLHESKYRGCTARCKPLISLKNRKARLDFAKEHLKKPAQFWKNILWIDETKINLYQNDGKKKVWRRRGTAHYPKHTTSSVKHGGGSVMAWACMAASGNGTLVFIDDVTQDRSSRMNYEVFRDILLAQIQLNAVKLIGRHFMIQMDNDPKHIAKATQEFIKAKKWKILEWPSQSPDLNSIEHVFHLLKTKLQTERPTNKQQLKAAAVKTWQSIKKEETQHLVMSMSSRLQAVIASKGFSTKY
uniref:Transposase n=1 Tax=Erpetoichthys calabaricus TaxID=27687 RepID=A0A8C4SI25_ERPCA